MSASVKRENDFVFYDDHRRYSFPVVTKFKDRMTNRYKLESGPEFWFDAPTNKVLTSDPNLSLQIVEQQSFLNPKFHLLLNIDDRILQVSDETGDGFVSVRPRNSDGTIVITIGDIGTPFGFYTGHSDEKTGIDRPMESRRQILSNAERFETVEQQVRAMGFLREVLSTYGEINDRILLSLGKETAAEVIISKALAQKIDNGVLVDG